MKWAVSWFRNATNYEKSAYQSMQEHYILLPSEIEANRKWFQLQLWQNKVCQNKVVKKEAYCP